MEKNNDPLDRLSKANPVPHDVTPNAFALERMIRSAQAPQPGIWSRARYAMTASTAAIGSGAAVLALIVGLGSAAPELPMLALGGTSGAKMSASADAVAGVATTLPGMVGGMAIYHPNYTFLVSPDLVVNGDTAGSYQLATSKSVKQVTEDLAKIFHLDGDLVDGSNDWSRSWSVTGTDGATLYVSENGGMMNWSYSASQTVSSPDVAATERVAALPAPSNDEAKANARELFDAIGYFGTLGNLEASRYDQYGGQDVQQVVAQNVQVSAPLLVNGVETDQGLSATYDGNGLSGANGVLADLGGVVNYPTISATDAIAALQASWNPAPDAATSVPEATETTIDNPDTTGTVQVTDGADDTSSAPAVMAPGAAIAPSGVSSDAGDVATGVAADTTIPAQVDPAPTYTTVPPQIVTITTATLRCQTYQLENGQTWLLPVWILDGYVGNDEAQAFSQTQLAVSSNYVKLPQNTGVMTY